MTVLRHMVHEALPLLPTTLQEYWLQSLLTPTEGMTYDMVPAHLPYKWRHQEHYLFMMNLQGQGAIQFPREKRLLRQAEMLLIPPHVPARLTPDRGWSLKILVIQCQQVKPPALRDNPWRRISLPTNVPHPDPEPLYEELEKLRLRPDYPERGRFRIPYQVFAHALLQELLAVYLQEGFLKGLLQETKPVPRAVKQAHETLRKNFQNPDFSVEELARNAGMSTNHLINSFRQHYGETPAQLLHRYRIRLAAHLFTGNPDVTIEHIAKRCGYRDRSSLHRQFRKYIGQSPGEYRRSGPAPLSRSSV